MTTNPLKELDKGLDARHIKTRNQGGMTLSYLEGHHVIREANRIFGFDGWSMEVVKIDRQEAGTINGKIVVSAVAQVKVQALGVCRCDIGTGTGIAKGLAQAIDGAVKEAATDGMKRALRTFGDQFGNALYDKSQKHVVHPADQKIVDYAAGQVANGQSADDVLKRAGEKGYNFTDAQVILIKGDV